MAEVVIRWTQNAAGREIGHVESVEKTEFVEAIIAQGRVEVLKGKDAKEALGEHEDDGPVALLGVMEAPEEEAPKAKRAAHKPEVVAVETPEDEAPVTAP